MKEIICAWIMRNLSTITVIYSVCFVLFILALLWNVSIYQKKQPPPDTWAMSFDGKVYPNVTVEIAPETITIPRLTFSNSKDLVIENNIFEGRFPEPENRGTANKTLYERPDSEN